MRDKRRDTLKGIAQHIRSSGRIPRGFTVVTGKLGHIKYIHKGSDVIFNADDNVTWHEIDEVLFAMREKNIIGNA